MECEYDHEWRIGKEVFLVYFRIPSRQSPSDSEESHKKPYTVQDILNRVSPE
jgi:hypothetical protein